jgi:hypothetical protein
MERIFFRLAVVVAMIGALGFGGRATWLHRSAIQSTASAYAAYQHLDSLQSVCGPKSAPMDPVCSPAAFDAAEAEQDSAFHAFMSLAKETEAARDARNWDLTTAAAFPFACLALFYALRWATTGRVRPLWPLGSHA